MIAPIGPFRDADEIWLMLAVGILLVGAALVGVSVASLLASACVAGRWFAFPEVVALAPLPLVAKRLAAALHDGLRHLALGHAGGLDPVRPRRGARRGDLCGLATRSTAASRPTGR